MNPEAWIRGHRTETFALAGGLVVVVALVMRRSSSSTSSGTGSSTTFGAILPSASPVASSTGTVPVATMDTTSTDLYNQTESQIQQLEQQMESVIYAQTVAGTPSVTQSSNPVQITSQPVQAASASPSAAGA